MTLSYGWIHYDVYTYYSSPINCLSGNIKTKITSCFRKELIDYINNYSIDCQNGIYGEVDEFSTIMKPIFL